MTATITSKGQITIPIEIRRRLRLEAGDVLHFDESAAFLKAKKAVDEQRMRSVFGCSRKQMAGLSWKQWREQTRGPLDLPRHGRRPR